MDIVENTEGQVLDIELEEDLLAKNRELAHDNRKLLDAHRVVCIDIMGSIGSGKTSLLEQVTSRLRKQYTIGVIAGDLTTEIDAKRLEHKNTQIVQIHTGKECHLDAHLVQKALHKMSLSDLDILFIENVGNLICPAEFPLGAHKRLVVISVTEGPYMVIKHPFIFRETHVVAINKIDLCEQMNVSPERLRKDIIQLNKKTQVVKTNCRTGEGVGDIIQCMNFQ